MAHLVPETSGAQPSLPNDLASTRAVCTPTEGPDDGTGETVHFSCPTRLQRAGRTPLEGVLEAPTQSGLSLCQRPTEPKSTVL